ncbi:FtsB family cell division protein [Compostimonas suwonensis]|uniref:FtsB family cell division protein n=1 Tax=Compostimonas suwonensis TaxID=1048394 RepID=UPI001FE5D0EB|nr:septum formation initiator family protein [Compostimonas suwonensis]
MRLGSTETPTGSWLRGIRLSGFSLLVMGMLVLAIVILAPGLRVYVEQRQEISQLNDAVAAQKADVAQLQAQRERWNDKTFIVSQARERLYYVMPGEVSFLVINDLQAPVAPADAAPVSSELQKTSVDWVQTTFQSLMAAGLGAVASDEPADAPAPDAPPAPPAEGGAQ